MIVELITNLLYCPRLHAGKTPEAVIQLSLEKVKGDYVKEGVDTTNDTFRQIQSYFANPWQNHPSFKEQPLEVQQLAAASEHPAKSLGLMFPPRQEASAATWAVVQPTAKRVLMFFNWLQGMAQRVQGSPVATRQRCYTMLHGTAQLLAELLTGECCPATQCTGNPSFLCNMALFLCCHYGFVLVVVSGKFKYCNAETPVLQHKVQRRHTEGCK